MRAFIMPLGGLGIYTCYVQCGLYGLVCLCCTQLPTDYNSYACAQLGYNILHAYRIT